MFLNRLSFKAVSYLAVASVGISLVLAAVRISSAISFSEPLQLTTSGAEHEFLYSIWKYINGLVLYNDQTKIPFTATFYNWLFYVSYGELAGMALRIFTLTDPWLPTVTRLITLAGGICGVMLAYRIFVVLLKIERTDLKLLSAAFAVYLFFGPLVGFFAFTTRPDTWALVFDLAALFVFIRLYDRRPLAAVLIFCVLTYAAWSFKQIFVYGPGTIGLFLLLRRDWKYLLVLIGITWSAWGMTLLIGGPIFTKMLLYKDTVIEFSIQSMLWYLGNFAIKSLPPLAGLAAVVVLPSCRAAAIDAVRNSMAARIAFLGLCITVLISLPASLKVGASEHYFFPLSFYITFLVLAVLAQMTKTAEPSPPLSGIISLGWIAGFFAVIVVLLGIKGVLSVRYIHEEHKVTGPCLQNLPQPAYVASAYLSLPWMMPAEQYFVFHYHYFPDRAGGIKMEAGGIGGLMDRGYFATVMLGKGSDRRFDGSDLKLYKKRSEPCGGFDIYARIEKAN